MIHYTRADEADLSLREHLEMRQTKSKQVLDAFYSWISQIESNIFLKSLIGKAITYAINQKEYLKNFLKDARIQLSNNLAEQSVKLFVIDRSNWLFANTPNGANASTMIYSIIQSAILNNLIPEKYLTYVFGTIQFGGDASHLVPWTNEILESSKILKETKNTQKVSLLSKCFSKLFIFYFTNYDTNISHNSTNFQLYVQYSNYNFPNSNFHLRKYHPAYPHSL